MIEPESDDNLPVVVGEDLARAAEQAERRKAFRYTCILKASRVGGETVAFKPFWLARVLNISTGGIALHVGEPFEMGTVLTIRLHTYTGEPITEPVDARVVHATEQSNSTWVLGLAFASELSEAEVQGFLG